MYLTMPGNRFAPLPNSCLGVVSTLREKEPLSLGASDLLQLFD